MTVPRGRRYREARARVLADATRCTWCACEISDQLPANHPQKASADHLHTVIAGGLDVVDNLIPACLTCNLKRGKMTVEEWERHLNHGVEGDDDW